MNRMDERFTHVADVLTFFVGKWYFSLLSLLLLIAWIIYGVLIIPGWFTSPVWSFPVNSVTTIGEWFLAGLTLAAANRVERRTFELLEEIKRHAQEDVRTTKRVERTLTGEEQ